MHQQPWLCHIQAGTQYLEITSASLDKPNSNCSPCRDSVP